LVGRLTNQSLDVRGHKVKSVGKCLQFRETNNYIVLTIMELLACLAINRQFTGRMIEYRLLFLELCKFNTFTMGLKGIDGKMSRGVSMQRYDSYAL